MCTVEDVYGSASNLYWIAFLLTARAELSFEVIMEVLDSENGRELISSPQALPHVRRRVVTGALRAIWEEVAASAQQTAMRPSDQPVIPIKRWFIGQGISQTQIEKAVVAIDVFSRCSLLLTVFEGLYLDDAAELLHCDRGLVARGREAGLWQLTRNLSSIALVVSLPLERWGKPALLR